MKRIYKIWIESWTGMEKAEVGHKFLDYKDEKVLVNGYREALEKAQEIKNRLREVNRVGSVTVWIPTKTGIDEKLKKIIQ